MHFSIKAPGAEQAGIVSVESPYDGAAVGTVATVSFKGVDQALKTSAALYRDRNSWLTTEERAAILERASVLMEERSEPLIALAVAEGGKPYRDTRAELLRAIDGVKNCRECLRSQHGVEVPMELNAASLHRLAFTHLEPIGPVVGISAFNHPINLIVHQIGPAIAAGCPVIIKPAQKTPLSAFMLVDIFREAGLPEPWCQPLLTENHAVIEALVADSRVAFFSFIGGSKVGWKLRSLLAPGVRCVFEHGGAAPVIAAADADLEAALPLLAKGGFYHAGQVCVSVQRVCAQKPIARQAAEGLAALAESLTTGDPADPESDVGPLIRPEEADRIDSWVKQAVAEGAELLTGGKRLSSSLYRPTVLFNPSDTSRVSKEEVFGPVVCVYECDDLDEAIGRANNVPFVFQASVLTRSIDTALYAFKHLRATAVMINDHTAFRVDWMPFGGLRESGMGTGGIPYSYRNLQIEKMAVFHSNAW
ncbi:MAG: aldehyde dehydrogenase family protein [Gammaproteobacteria bacterium]